jgi:hypothetical protein
VRSEWWGHLDVRDTYKSCAIRPLSLGRSALYWHVAETTLLWMQRVGPEYFHWICPGCCMMRPTRANKPNGYLLGSYRIATAPEPNSSRLTSLKSTGFDSPANNVGP